MSVHITAHCPSSVHEYTLLIYLSTDLPNHSPADGHQAAFSLAVLNHITVNILEQCFLMHMRIIW